MKVDADFVPDLVTKPRRTDFLSARHHRIWTGGRMQFTRPEPGAWGEPVRPVPRGYAPSGSW